MHEPPDDPEKVAAAAMALRFVYPTLKFNDTQISAEVAVWALLMARALDRTSRLTYGAFELYRVVATGSLRRAVRWTDLTLAMVRGARSALGARPRKNRIAEAFIQMQFSQRNLAAHLEDPERTPLVTPRISAASALDRWVWGL